jgi:hypothetical protein
MTACKTGCGSARRVNDDKFCESCRVAWIMSPERDRYCAARTPAAEGVALVDFCARVRAEHQNTKPEGT